MTDAEKSAYALLDDLGIAYRVLAHERVSAIEDCLPIAERLGGVVPRNYFLAPRNQSEFYLLLAHPDSVFRTSSVSRQAGASRLMFAPEDTLLQLLHTHPGAVSPLGLMFESARDVRLLVDRRLLRENVLVFHPLENTASVALQSADFFDTFLRAIHKAYTPVDMERKESSSHGQASIIK